MELRDIVGYEGEYQVSSSGWGYSLKYGRPRVLKQEVTNNSTATTYRRVTLSKDGVTTRYAVHRLVATAFISNPENKPQVNHIDNIGYHTHFTNLEWVTAVENMQHSAQQGRQDVVRSLGCAAAKTKCDSEEHQKLITLLGKRLLLVTTKNHRRYVTFTCVCGTTYTKRKDSPYVVEGGVCRHCR